MYVLCVCVCGRGRERNSENVKQVNNVIILMGNCCCSFIRLFLLPIIFIISLLMRLYTKYISHASDVTETLFVGHRRRTKIRKTKNVTFRSDEWTFRRIFLFCRFSPFCAHSHHRLLWQFCYKIKLIWFARMHLRSETHIILQCCSHNALLSKGKQCC